MVSFGEYLSNYMQKYDLTISGVSSKANIDRTLLSKVLSGDRTLNPATFKKLLSVLTPNNYEEEKLTELYAIMHFGHEKYAGIIYIRKFLSASQQKETDRRELPTLTDAASNAHKVPFALLSSQFELKIYIRQMLARLSKQASPLIYTNYSYDFLFLNKAILDLLQTHCGEVDYKHMVCFSGNDPKNSELQCYINSLPFAQLGYETNYYASSEPEHNFDNIFPYYLIVNDRMLFFNAAYTDGFLIMDSDFIETYKREFRKKIQQCNTMIRIEPGIARLRDYSQLYSSGPREILHIAKDLSLFITEDALHLLEYDRADPVAVQNLYIYCDINAQILSDYNFFDIILYKEAIDAFIADGKLSPPGGNLAIVVPEEKRYDFLLGVLNYLKQKNVSFSLTTDKIQQISSDIHLTVIKNEAYKSDILLTDSFITGNPAPSTKQNLLVFDNRSIINDYCNFIEYLMLFSYTESRETSLKYLEKHVAYLQRTTMPELVTTRYE